MGYTKDLKARQELTMGNAKDDSACTAAKPLPLRKIATMKPEELPTKKDLKDAIPAHCFKHSTPLSLALVLRDFIVISALWLAAWKCLPMETDWTSMTGLAGKLGWGVYWFLQGTAFTGWWVLAHECGHGGFSASGALNDSVGFVLHSVLLVPYFSWQYSHAKHHAKTNHLLDGETHTPPAKKGQSAVLMAKLHEIIGDDAFAVYELFSHLLFGWPAYLLVNATGARRDPQGKRMNTIHDHFRPWSKLFPARRNWDTRVVLSDIGILCTLFGLYMASNTYGARVHWQYWPSYLWTNFWLVLYTWLQHTAPDLPFWGEDEWTWVRGGLCTIDRPYGVFDWMHHHIGSTHVTHHLFSNLPCYHAVEATASLKAFLEPKGLYHYDPTPWPIAAWRTASTCHYVEDVKGIQFYKSMKYARDLKRAAEKSK
jgi:omega-6 fatty acid desaturase (delta-12 desaturase)